jgi:hypothetical protein
MSCGKNIRSCAPELSELLAGAALLCAPTETDIPTANARIQENVFIQPPKGLYRDDLGTEHDAIRRFAGLSSPRRSLARYQQTSVGMEHLKGSAKLLHAVAQSYSDLLNSRFALEKIEIGVPTSRIHIPDSGLFHS